MTTSQSYACMALGLVCRTTKSIAPCIERVTLDLHVALTVVREQGRNDCDKIAVCKTAFSIW
jgi:hypothetical protein